VDNSRSVGGAESIGNLHGIPQRLGQSEPLARNQLVQSLTRDIFHDDEVEAGVARDVVNRNNVRVVQGGRRLSFLHKTAFAFWICDLLRRKNLQRDSPVEMRVLRLIHHSHTTLAELVQDAVMRNRTTGHLRSSLLCAPNL
jgi:hypothetical protein